MRSALEGKRIKYVRMKGGWGYGTILKDEPGKDVVAHLDCQDDGEEWHIKPEEIGRRYFLCDSKE